MSNDHKVAIVTGASRGMGAGIVAGYRRRGFVVVANSRDIEAGSDEGVIAVAGDIGDRKVAERVVRTALDRFGRIDSLVNNAGIFIGRPFTKYTMEDFHNIFNVNIAGFFNMTQLVIAQMLEQGGGHIVQITASLVTQPISGRASGLPALTKGGLDAITRELAIEYAGQNIRVNAVAPGPIKTPMHKPENYGILATMNPMHQVGEIEDVVDAVLYLEGARFVTGETLRVDGGQHAGR